MTSFGQNLLGLLLVVVVVFASIDARPPYYEENEIERTQPGIVYNPYYLYPAMNRYPENQYEKLRLLFEGQDPKTGSGVENILREPESKRQAVRYRQCYFNPISCFRK